MRVRLLMLDRLRGIQRPLVPALVVAFVLAGPAAQAWATPDTAPTSDAPADVVDAQDAPDEASALAIAQAFDHPVVINSSLTATTEVAAQPDGTQQLTINSEAVRVQQDGEWADVDTTLMTTANGMLAPRTPVTPVEFSPGGGGPMARIQTADGSWVSVDPPLGDLPEPTLDDDSATYTDLVPGVDLQLTATKAGMSEVLIVQTPEASNDPRLADLTLGLPPVRLTPCL